MFDKVLKSELIRHLCLLYFCILFYYFQSYRYPKRRKKKEKVETLCLKWCLSDCCFWKKYRRKEKSLNWKSFSNIMIEKSFEKSKNWELIFFAPRVMLYIIILSIFYLSNMWLLKLQFEFGINLIAIHPKYNGDFKSNINFCGLKMDQKMIYKTIRWGHI
jgi:hypothetical protein